MLGGLGIPLLGMIFSCPNPKAFTLIPLYPLGLDYLITRGGGPHLLISGYVVLGGLVIATFVVKSRFRFFIICGFLAVACMLTTHGCRGMMEEVGSIGS